MTGPKSTYCFDTSALTEWWIRRYPPDVLPGLVLRVEQLIAEGRAIIPSFVLAELEEGGDDLFNWAKGQRGFSVNEEAPVQEFAARLLAEYHNPVKPTKGIGNADPFVIALAASASPYCVIAQVPLWHCAGAA